ncbi:MAG: hypothetical protein KGZ92_01850 [Firmicutes bacterium]|nr:hypothetical protein [Dethiobacter sp.]MBS3888027.1 hypothetical protein [Bacillota bacterium]MBS4055052.1 hypothetical protein [Thermaerobacter sp.]
MPNYKVFQDSPASLRTRMHGVLGDTDLPLVVDPSGVMAIQDNGGAITVDAVSLDVRNLGHVNDSIQVYGFDGTVNRPLLTDASGRVQCIVTTMFLEATQTVVTGTDFVGGTERDVSTVPTYTWFVQNIGGVNSAEVLLEISPNAVDWVTDGLLTAVLPGTSLVLVPSIFLRYTRISYRSAVPLADTSLVLTWQAHN